MWILWICINGTTESVGARLPAMAVRQAVYAPMTHCNRGQARSYN